MGKARRVHTVNGFSAYADTGRSGSARYRRICQGKRDFPVHAEDDAVRHFSGLLKDARV